VRSEVAPARFFLSPYNREGAEHVIGFLTRKAVEVEIQRVKPGAAPQPVLLVRSKGRLMIALISGKARHVVRGVREMKDVIADDFRRGSRPKPTSVPIGRNDWELLHNVPVQMLTLNFLTRYVVKYQ
jgi:hypothetical protein